MQPRVSLTFDDAKLSVYENAFPILDELELTATIYVITSRIGKDGYMTREMLTEVANAGWEISSHTHTHPNLKECSFDEVKKEYKESKRIVEQILDSSTNDQSGMGIAYPYGKYHAVGIREAILSEEIFEYGRINSNRKKNREQVVEKSINRPPFTQSMLMARNPFRKPLKDYQHNITAIENGWFILYFHGIDKDTSPDTRNFNEICEDIAKRKNNGEFVIQNPIEVKNDSCEELFSTLFTEDRVNWIRKEADTKATNSMSGKILKYISNE